MKNLLFQQQQGCGRTLLTAVPECGLQNMFDCLITISHRRDDGCIFPPRLRKKSHLRLSMQHVQCCISPPRQDHGINQIIRNKRFPHITSGTRHHLQSLLWHSPPIKAFAQQACDQHGIGCWLQNHTIPGSKCSGDSTAWDGYRKVPWRDHHDYPPSLCSHAVESI